MSVGLKRRLSLSVISTYKAQSLAPFCLPLLYPQIALTYSFLPRSSLVQKAPNLGRLKKDLGKKIKIFKLLVEILRLSLYKLELEYKPIVPFSSSQSPLSTLFPFNVIIFHVIHHVTAFDQ